MLQFLRATEKELLEMTTMKDVEVSDESLRIMKRIFRKLRVLIVRAELAAIERKKEQGRLTPKQARNEKAKVKKRWL